MGWRLTTQRPVSPPPWVVWGMVLITISLTEFAVMVTLPRLLPANTSRVWDSIVDAILLTSIISPLMWWSTVRPLQEAARLRERFVSDLIAGTERERRRIAHELHDGLGQSLTLLVSGLRSLSDLVRNDEPHRRVVDLARIAQQALSDAKQMAMGLRPSLLDDLGLANAIQRLADDVANHEKLGVSVVATTVEGHRFLDEVETAMFRICQEALQNVCKHSKASQVAITLSLAGDHLRLEVSDNGQGIESIRRSPTSGQLGLIGIRERATLLRGQLTIVSVVGQGTRLIVELPAQRQKEETARCASC